jgi:amino acid carrier protein
MQNPEQILQNISSLVWGLPMLILLIGCHIFLTFRLKFIQRYIGKAIKLSITSDEEGHGDINQFGSLATALAATIGTGNIIGVSTAIALGGPGAVFWTWITGILGMSTKYAESLLSMQYRQKNKVGNFVGGPMYVLEKGLNMKILAVLFAVFTALATFGTGCAIQSKAISEIIKFTFNVPLIISGIIITVCAALVILGGLNNISKVCEKLVPFMALFYVGGSLIILILNIQYLPNTIVLILKSAFTTRAAGAGFVGSTMITACRYGVSRGLFSNESGLGTAPIVSASAKSKNCVRQALVSMSGTFWDTVIVCAMTGLVLVSSIVKNPIAFENVANDKLTGIAFQNLGAVGGIILAISLAIFAFTTILGWCFYGERCVEYLFGIKAIKYYRILFLITLFMGTVFSLDIVWSFSDITNGLMAFPNILSLLLLTPLIVSKTRYFLWENRLEEKE